MTSQEIEKILSLNRVELVQRWEAVMRKPPPSRLSRQMMAKILITELQWRASGQSRPAVVRKFGRAICVAESDKPIASKGKRLVREWNGLQHIVDVTADGYVWNGRTWTSLSVIAKEITGTKWSGPRFFGVSG
jgi:hypothetical protein